MPVILSIPLLIAGAILIGTIFLTFRRRFIILRDLTISQLKVKKRKLIVHMVSETAWVTQGQGVHTAFIEMMQLLSEDSEINLVVNNEGHGDVFHSHTYGPYYFYKGWRYKGRRILTAHVIPDSSKGTIPFWKQLFPLTKIYLKTVYNFADVIIAISPTVERSICELGVKSKIVRINNPVLTENWRARAGSREAGRKKLDIDVHEKLILGVGQLQERKGVEDFIDIAAKMPEAKFVWVGGRPWGVFTEGIQRIDERIAHAPPNIQFTGLLDLEQMPEMYAAADLFLFPSYQENCPLAPLEAAAAGLPVIFRNIPEYKTLFGNPYLNANNTKEFVRLTWRMLIDRTFYDDAVKMSIDLIGGFDKRQIRQSTIQLYKDVFQSFKSNNL